MCIACPAQFVLHDLIIIMDKLQIMKLFVIYFPSSSWYFPSLNPDILCAPIPYMQFFQYGESSRFFL